MNEIIQFKARPRKREAVGVVSEPVDRWRPDPFAVEIPSLDALFDENRSFYLGLPVSEFRTQMEGTTDSADFTLRLENNLADSRAQFILDNIPDEKEADPHIIELGKVTYAAGVRTEDAELKEFGRNFLIPRLGIRRAMSVMESIRIKIKFAQVNGL